MGFTPELVGLAGESINHPFREARASGPHKGIDITSSKTPRSFKAGVFGRVVAPTNTEWGTISVQPFNRPECLIQFLHCSSYNVGVGSLIAPWTILGQTGDTAPPGSGVEGIHLHIQVIEPGAPTDSAWDRNYVDPAAWDLGAAESGTWQGTIAFPDGVAHHTKQIQSLEVGSNHAHTAEVIRNVQGRCDLQLTLHCNCVVTAHNDQVVIFDLIPVSMEVRANSCGFDISLGNPRPGCTLIIGYPRTMDVDLVTNRLQMLKAGNFYEIPAEEAPPLRSTAGRFDALSLSTAPTIFHPHLGYLNFDLLGGGGYPAEIYPTD